MACGARAVLAFAMRRADPDTAHDVLSETFLVAWRRIDELPAEPRPWLLGTARKVLANHRRAAERRGALHERIDEAFIRKHVRDISQNFYLCGPDPMVKQLRETLEGLGAGTEAVTWEK